MDIEYLRTVKTVASLGSYQIAAEKLSCSVSTISYQIHKTEEEMNVCIFERVGRNMRVTPGGARALQLIDNVLNSLDAMNNLREKAGCPLPKLNIAVADSIFLYRVCPMLDRIEAMFPHTQLSFSMMNCGEVKAHISTGIADFGVHFSFDSYDESMHAEKIGEEPLVLVGSASIKDADRDFITPNQQKHLHLIEYSSKAFIQNRINEYLTRKNIGMISSVYIDSSEAAKRCLLNFPGVSYMPKMSVEKELESGELVELDTGDWHESLQMIFAHRKKGCLLPVADYVKTALEKCILG